MMTLPIDVAEIRYNKALGAAMKHYREKKKVKIDKVAKAMGVTVGHCQVIESGKNKISAFRVMRYAEAIGLTPTPIMRLAQHKFKEMQ